MNVVVSPVGVGVGLRVHTRPNEPAKTHVYGVRAVLRTIADEDLTSMEGPVEVPPSSMAMAWTDDLDGSTITTAVTERVLRVGRKHSCVGRANKHAGGEV